MAMWRHPDMGNLLMRHRNSAAAPVVSPRHYAIKEFPAGAELHDEVHVVVVLVGALKQRDVGVAAQVV
jgi:hypothetical protein